MLSAYRQLLGVPGARPLLSAGVIARLPRAMVGLGIVTMISRRTGDYALAGGVCAVYSLAAAGLGPRVARAIDRHGQRSAARSALAVAVGGVLALAACSFWQAPVWTLFPCAAAAGMLPNIGGMARARWTHLFGDSPRLHTAYSAESVSDELSFIAGPIVAVALATGLFPEAGLLGAVVVGTAGVLALTAQRGTEPPVSASPRSAHVIRNPGLQSLVMVFGALGMVFSATEVVTVAFAADVGERGAAGYALASFGVTSALAGLLVGARKLNSSPPLRLTVCLGAMAVCLTALPFMHGMTTLTLVLLSMGLFISPSMITGYSLVEAMVDRDQLNEGLTWQLSGCTCGLSLGAIVGGVAVEQAGVRTALWVPVICAALAALIAAGSMRRLRRGPAAAAVGSGRDTEESLAGPVVTLACPIASEPRPAEWTAAGRRPFTGRGRWEPQTVLARCSAVVRRQ